MSIHSSNVVKCKDRPIGRNLALSIMVLPVVLLILMAFITLFKGTRDIGIWLLAENHPVEMMTFLFLFIGSIYGCIITADFRNNQKKYVVMFYGVFSLFLFLVAMEEKQRDVALPIVDGTSKISLWVCEYHALSEA